jgi:hypothetical protein
VPASFYSLECDTPVVDRFGRPVGKVEKVLIAYDHFDGVIVSTPAGPRFVDAPEVRRIEEDEVELAVALSDVLHPGPKGPPGPPGIHSVRRDRDDATDDDRLDVEGLERRIERIHRATRLGELDAALDGLL